MILTPKKITEYREKKGLSPEDLALLVGVSGKSIRYYESGERIPKHDKVLKIIKELGIEEGTNVTNNDSRLIPFFDVITVGGTQNVANMDAVTQPSEWIDAGDCFREATAAIGHYNDSMKEYPSGSILFVKEVYDVELIVPGRNYVIETSEYRITKKVNKGKPGIIKAYSTNDATYPDGSLIHQPIDIPLKKISCFYLVVGHVEKEGSLFGIKRNKS